MDSVRLGKSGLNVSRLSLGTMNFGTEVAETDAFAIMDAAADAGIYSIDCADVYPAPVSPATWGLTEEIVGRWLRGKRERFVISTKCANRVGPGANDAGGSRKHIIEACERSLVRLGTDRIDIFYLHLPDISGAPLEESLLALDRLVQDGKVLYIGLSNFKTWQVACVLQSIAESRLTKLTVLQDRYNLVSRGNELDLYPLAQHLGLGLMAYNPLGAGVLAGLIRRGDPAPVEGRFTMGLYQNRYLRDEVFDVAEEVRRVAEEIGFSMAQVALAWILAQKNQVVPIVGALQPSHVADSAQAVKIEFPREALDSLERLSARFRSPQDEVVPIR